MAHRVFQRTNLRSVFLVLSGAAMAAGIPGDSGTAAFNSSAPYDIVASGFGELSGIAAQADGSVLVTDRRAGTLTKITATGVQRVLGNLQDPRGVAVSARGVLVLEGAGRVLLMDAAGGVSVMPGAPNQPSAIAVGPDDRIWIAARKGLGTEYEIVRLETSGALTRVASGLIQVRALAADTSGIFVALASLAGETQSRTTLAKIPWRPDGTPGAVESLLRNNMPGLSYGVTIDAAGDVFVTGATGNAASGVVIKRRQSGQATFIASSLPGVGAAVFGAYRDLFVVEAGVPMPVRVLRFRPPAVPSATVPPFTNQTPLRIEGHAEAGSLVQVLDESDRPVAAAIADSTTDAFTLMVPLADNDRTQLHLVATGSAGAGLVGLPSAVSVLHDSHLPVVEILAPSAAAHMRGVIAVRARAVDEASGISTIRVVLGTMDQSAVSMEGEPLVVSALIDTDTLNEGPHSLDASATDRAGNHAGIAQLIVVDRTPPETIVTGGPPSETPDRSVTLTFGGSDAQSTDLEFAWRLDDGSWSAFSPATVVQLADLSTGPHRFEVVARDRAGNVDTTPAAYAFTVIGLRVRILEPSAGTAIGTETVWVRGTIAGAGDIGVSITLPEPFKAALGREGLVALHEGGLFAGEVPVVPGMTSLTVSARDAAGRVATDTVPVSAVEPLVPHVQLEAFPSAGLVPHVVRFSTNAFPVGSVYSLDLETDGIPDYAGNALPEQSFVYDRAGIHLATLQIATPDGRMLVARGAIEVYDRTVLESRLRTTWMEFKAALRAGDAAAAALFVHSERRAPWASYFGRLTPAQFAATDTVFTDVTLLEVVPGRVECEMMREIDGVPYSFPVSFRIDIDGGWRLWQF